MAAILRWVFVLVLLLTVAGGGAAYWFYSRSDEGLRQLVLQELNTLAPTLKFDIAKAQFDIFWRVRIYGLTVCLPGEAVDAPSLEVPEVIITLDSDQMTDFKNAVIRKLYIVKPTLRLVRMADGQLNWPKIAVSSGQAAAPPDIEVEHATIVADFQLAGGGSRQLQFKNFNVTARPADSKRYTVQVATLLGPAGPLMLEIDSTLDGSQWKCETREPWQLPVDEKLLQLLCDLSPDVADHLAKTKAWINAKSHQAGLETVPVSRSTRFPHAEDVSAASDFGVRCRCGLHFRVQKDGANQPMAFKALADITQGEINNGLFPLPFSDLEGKIYADNRQIIVTGLKASSGPTQVAFDGKIVPSTPMSGTVELRGVEINDSLKSRLPVQLRKIVQSLGLTGVCDIDATFTQNGGGWDQQISLRLEKGTVTHERFPVTVRDVSGKLRLQDGSVEFDAAGTHAGQTLTAYGTIIHPGPEQEGEIVVKGENLPIDDESLAACPATIRTSIEALNLSGRHDVLLRVARQSGLHQRWEPELIERIRDGSLNFNDFPYSIQKLQGIVRWKGDVVEFNDLSGTHDGANLFGAGRFYRVPDNGRLELVIEAKNAAFDRSLQHALPATLQFVWNQFQPHGAFDVVTRIDWSPGWPCVVRLPKVLVHDGEVTMKCFPWTFQKLNGEFTYNMEPGKLEIRDLVAWHNAARISAKGIGSFASLNPWRLSFDQLEVDSLNPDLAFRNALPDMLRRAFDCLQPMGIYSFKGPAGRQAASFYGPTADGNSIGAEWEFKTVLSNCSILAGTRIEGINGETQIVGKWDGIDATIKADLLLDSLTVFRQAGNQGYQISKIRGPISYRDHRLVAGNEAAILPRVSDRPDDSKRISGRFIDGTVYLDADVHLLDEPEYRTFVELKNGKLEHFAQQYLRHHSGLAGVSNGWMNLRGKGTNSDRMSGDGRLVISPAALYDSPLFIQLFRTLQMKQPGKTTFENAKVEFTVGNGRFDLNRIEMHGEELSMGGRGVVRFDGVMRMDYGVYLRQWIPNPFPLIVIAVTGTVGDPQVERVKYLKLDGPLKQFLEAFDPRRMGQQPAPAARMGQKMENSKN